MQTGRAIVLSVAIVAAIGAALAALGYLAMRRIFPQGIPAKIDVPLPQRIATAAEARTQAQAREHVQAVLAPLRAKLDASRRPVLALRQTPMAQDDALASKIGGRAYWTAQRPYPTGVAGAPLFLLAQLDLATLRLRGYPQRGLLQFFVAADAFYGANLDAPAGDDWMRGLARQTNFRVVYWPHADAAAAIAPPPAALRAHDGLPFDPAVPYRLTGEPGEEAIGAGDVHVADMLGAAPDALVDAYVARHPGLSDDALTDAVYDVLDRFGSKLGGYPAFTQQDPRVASDRSVLLLQLDSGDGLMWGDSGVANFFIDPEDLARADFSRVAYHWDCY